MYLEFPADGVVLALDPAKHTGFACGRPSAKPALGVVNFEAPHDTAVDTFGRAAAWFSDFVATHRPNLIAIESVIAPGELWGGTNYRTTALTHGFFAIFCGLGRAAKVPVIEAPIRTWRKYFLGAGNLRGPVAKAACVRLCRQLGWNDERGYAPSHDAAEAAGIWCWAGAQVEPKLTRRIEPLFLTGSPE